MVCSRHTQKWQPIWTHFHPCTSLFSWIKITNIQWKHSVAVSSAFTNIHCRSPSFVFRAPRFNKESQRQLPGYRRVSVFCSSFISSASSRGPRSTPSYSHPSLSPDSFKALLSRWFYCSLHGIKAGGLACSPLNCGPQRRVSLSDVRFISTWCYYISDSSVCYFWASMKSFLCEFEIICFRQT